MRVETFQSMRQFSCNVYVASSDKGNVLIDPGHYDEEIRDCLNEVGGLDAILITHGHWDHTYGLDGLEADFPGVPAYMPRDSHDFLRDPALNGSLPNGFAEMVRSDVTLIDEGSLRVAGYDVDVIDTPGHCRGCDLYHFKDEGVLFTGDTIMKDIPSPIRLTGSARDQSNSIRKFMGLGYPADTPTYPGHGESTTYGYLLENNPEVRGER